MCCGLCCENLRGGYFAELRAQLLNFFVAWPESGFRLLLARQGGHFVTFFIHSVANHQKIEGEPSGENFV